MSVPVILGLVVLVLWLMALAFLLGQLSILSENVRESQRALSWAKIRTAQAAFNVDFFDELHANGDPRLLKGSDDE